MSSLTKLDAFYQALSEIRLVNENVDDKRNELKSLIFQFQDKMHAIKLNKDLLEKNDSMRALLQETSDEIQSAANSWMERFDEVLMREKFRSDLEN